MDDDSIQRKALEIFVAEFVLESPDRLQSRGFFDGMQLLLAAAPADSPLARAARLVVLACVGNRMGRCSLVSRSKTDYGVLLQVFQKRLARNTAKLSIEDLYTAVLLGLFEVESY